MSQHFNESRVSRKSCAIALHDWMAIWLKLDWQQTEFEAKLPSNFIFVKTSTGYVHEYDVTDYEDVVAATAADDGRNDAFLRSTMYRRAILA